MVKSIKRACLLLLAALLLLTAGCGRESVSADLQAVYDAILQLPGSPEMMPLSDKRIGSYYGIDTARCPQAIAAVCEDGLRVDEIWLFEAGSETEAEQILTLAQSHLEQICEETKNYFPDQYAAAKQGRALRIGNYTALFVSPQAEAMERLFRESLGK